MKLSACMMLVAVALAAAAKDFPLEFRTLQPEEVKTFPAAFYSYGRLREVKPGALVKEPKATCRQPLYGTLNEGKSNTFVFRIEESKDGNGYDRLLLDLNQNGDLTDEPLLEGQLKAEPDKSMPKSQFTTFWPIPVSADKMIGSWRVPKRLLGSKVTVRIDLPLESLEVISKPVTVAL